MKALYDVAAPAKLNLFLHITGRRADGYHLLQSAFMLIDWCDTLHFEPRADGIISREDLHGIATQEFAAPAALPVDDLVVRAARALQSTTGCTLGAHIGLCKRIPQQAGMGGGSSDAASCLLALNRLWQLNLPLAQLQAIGLRLGADVPFFLAGRNAWVEGIGEKITALCLPPARFRVVKPAAGLDTSRIFAAPALRRDTQTATISGFAVMPSNEMFGFGRNDLQPVAQALCPQVTQALQWLASLGLSPRMTGSGSAVFAKLVDASQTSDSAGLPALWQVRDCSNLEVHPLFGWAS
ncbi:MAG: 4-(cytidine 5'-diphospho)-2-C-methyl-D-erythritol kinase [Burkholderiales bacterium]